MNLPHRPEPAKRARPPGAPSGLLFCAVCQVSVASSELESGPARWTPRGRVFCGVCATATPEERLRRREELENEFADDAPVLVPAPIRARAAASVPPAPSAPTSPRSADVAFLEARVGELERAAFRLQARVATLEERLEEALKRAE
jgi:uncharacterized Zn finger protein (UPF0148 family)